MAFCARPLAEWAVMPLIRTATVSDVAVIKSRFERSVLLSEQLDECLDNSCDLLVFARCEERGLWAKLDVHSRVCVACGPVGVGRRHFYIVLPKPAITLCNGRIARPRERGVKVLLSIGVYNDGGGNYKVATGQKGVDFADFLWSAFGPYDKDWNAPRPFDADDRSTRPAM
ncbi:hypothetical protein CEP51_016111 [Fusarium floridanum]|uniref:Uncharacterized protein n=1 Tax=Fusarium floridanum TaxID=1325733 RepID=A0A428NWV1_9HYPO|nr:hypothetical protein CEP51_016111 [Fusarium floridanum]